MTFIIKKMAMWIKMVMLSWMQRMSSNDDALI